MQIYVGNLAYSVSEEDLTEAFSAFGDVASVNIIKDRMTGQSKGFGFVEMPSDADAQSAIKSLDGKSINGRPARVNKSEPKKEGGGGGPRRPRY
ncbi:MAG: RNA recognition motif domain-containing protein [Thiotrichales bacterium]